MAADFPPLGSNENGDSPMAPPFRVGLGWDRHRLEPLEPAGAGKPMIVGGVQLKHNLGPVGHSDGDALLHAVTDAILGAVGGPDIGQLFPNDDPRNAGQDSAVFLTEAVKRAHELGWMVGNIDVVVILERPKIGPVKESIRANLAKLLGVNDSAVNIKGKTGEQVDATGEGRAIDVHAVVLMSRHSMEKGAAN
jgi:2-C-methyl-D-erythritol 2,4-cyclodiphosphate synthase